MDHRHLIVLELCPNIVNDPECKIIDELRWVLSNESVITPCGNEWHARVGKSRFIFKKEPTDEYLSFLINKPRDLSRQIAAVNVLRKMIVSSSRGVEACRQVTVKETKPRCKGCFGTEFIDCVTHFTCRNGTCAVVRRKVEQGLDYRNIKERSQSTGDRNTSNYHTLDPMVSDALNRQTVVAVAPGVAAGAKDGAKAMSVRNLNAWNKRLWRDASLSDHITAQDVQYVRAKRTIEDISEDLFLGSATPKKALSLFSRFLRSRVKLPREQETIAACLFEALPPKPKIYPPKKKRKLTPYNDTRQKRLRRMTF